MVRGPASIRPAGPTVAGEVRRRKGQALIETCLVMIVLCLILFGALQISRLFAAREILDYAAARGARAQTVGFNRFMVYKTIRVGAIPNAGQLISPDYAGALSSAGDHDWSVAGGGARWSFALSATPSSPQQALESARIPLYLGATLYGHLPATLDYDRWDSISQQTTEGNGDRIQVRVSQEFPLVFPLHRAFYAADSVPLEGRCDLENHAALYLNNQGW
jgi:hypothetical protein